MRPTAAFLEFGYLLSARSGKPPVSAVWWSTVSRPFGRATAWKARSATSNGHHRAAERDQHAARQQPGTVRGQSLRARHRRWPRPTPRRHASSHTRRPATTIGPPSHVARAPGCVSLGSASNRRRASAREWRRTATRPAGAAERNAALHRYDCEFRPDRPIIDVDLPRRTTPAQPPQSERCPVRVTIHSPQRGASPIQ